MLELIFAVLLMLWIFGFVTSLALTTEIHLLLILAIALLAARILRGRAHL
jgi:hypothetical protein